MKKLLCLCTVLLMAFSLTACARKKNPESSRPVETSQPIVSDEISSGLNDDTVSDNMESGDNSSEIDSSVSNNMDSSDLSSAGT